MKPKVYFSKTITPEKVLELYKLINKPLSGKVGIKIHSGETGNQNFLRPEFWQPLIEYVNGSSPYRAACGSVGSFCSVSEGKSSNKKYKNYSKTSCNFCATDI